MSTEPGPLTCPSLDAHAALAELGRISFAGTSMDALLHRIAELAKRVTPGVEEASVSLVVDDKARTAAFTGRLALDLDESQSGWVSVRAGQSLPSSCPLSLPTMPVLRDVDIADEAAAVADLTPATCYGHRHRDGT